jgi:hypothetical protein
VRDSDAQPLQWTTDAGGENDFDDDPQSSLPVSFDIPADILYDYRSNCVWISELAQWSIRKLTLDGICDYYEPLCQAFAEFEAEHVHVPRDILLLIAQYIPGRVKTEFAHGMVCSTLRR